MLHTGRSTVLGANGMAATAHPLATLTAIEILKAGGSAVDAAIAANAMLGLVEPVGCGVGGDLFAIVWDPSGGSLVGLDASGRAPAARILESTGVDRIPPVGPLSVTVPGAVDGWFRLAERFGRLPMARLLDPAIRYARQGAPIPEVIADHWARNLAYFQGTRSSIRRPSLRSMRPAVRRRRPGASSGTPSSLRPMRRSPAAGPPSTRAPSPMRSSAR